MAEEWRIPRRTRVCARSGATIRPDCPFYSALVEKDDAFERLDFSPEAWPEVDKTAFYSFWKNKGADETEKKAPVDFERLLDFFDSLEGAAERRKQLFRYVLALALARRRRLRLDGMSRTELGDSLTVFDRRANRSLEITAPEATNEELEQVQENLSRLFECDLDAAAGE